MKKIVAILSSTVLSGAGTYRYDVLGEMPAVSGISHYIGHPATKFILDGAGAVYVPGYFSGLKIGESFLVAQLKDPRKGSAFTTDSPNVGPDDLKWGVVTRIE